MAKSKAKGLKKGVPKAAKLKKKVLGGGQKKAAPVKKASSSKKNKIIAKTKLKKQTSAKKSAKKAAPVKTAKPAAKAKTPKSLPTKTKTMKTKLDVYVKPPAAKIVDLTQFFTPLDDRIVVQILEPEKRTAGGLYIPDTVTSTTGNYKGTVVAVGRGHREKKGKIRPMDVKKGDQVLFSEYAGSKVNFFGQELAILRENDVLGVVTQ